MRSGITPEGQSVHAVQLGSGVAYRLYSGQEPAFEQQHVEYSSKGDRTLLTKKKDAKVTISLPSIYYSQRQSVRIVLILGSGKMQLSRAYKHGRGRQGQRRAKGGNVGGDSRSLFLLLRHADCFRCPLDVYFCPIMSLSYFVTLRPQALSKCPTIIISHFARLSRQRASNRPIS